MKTSLLAVVCMLAACSPSTEGSGRVGSRSEDNGAISKSSPHGCDLPPEQGRCEAMFPRFYFDPESGGCKPFDYGGCEGNANNFGTAAACILACAKTAQIEAVGNQGEVAIGCKIGEVYYPSGAGAVPAPDRSNTCRCDAGELRDCTRRAGLPCPSHTVFGTRCVEKASTGGCLIVESGCLPEQPRGVP